MSFREQADHHIKSRIKPFIRKMVEQGINYVPFRLSEKRSPGLPPAIVYLPYEIRKEGHTNPGFDAMIVHQDGRKEKIQIFRKIPYQGQGKEPFLEQADIQIELNRHLPEHVPRVMRVDAEGEVPEIWFEVSNGMRFNAYTIDSPEKARRLFRQCGKIEAFIFHHLSPQDPYIYSDIHPSNIRITKDGQVHWMDFDTTHKLSVLRQKEIGPDDIHRVKIDLLGDPEKEEAGDAFRLFMEMANFNLQRNLELVKEYKRKHGMRSYLEAMKEIEREMKQNAEKGWFEGLEEGRRMAEERRR